MTDRSAFDHVAASYAGETAANLVFGGFRARLRAAVAAAVEPPARLLDVGCGPGLDAEYFARLGYRVTAIDASAGMVAAARARASAAGPHGFEVVHLPVEDIDRLDPAPFDLVYSDLGPLNCVADLPAAVSSLARHLRPGGTLVISVMARVSPWEWLLFGTTGRWRRLRARFGRDRVMVPLGDAFVATRYYSVADLRDAARAAGCEVRMVRSLGLLVPPPYSSLVHRRSLVRALQHAEDAVASWPLLRSAGDHLLAVLQSPRR